MVKRITIAAVVVVAIVLIAAIAVVLLPQPTKTEKVIYWTQIAPIDQKNAIKAGTVEAGVAWEPYVSEALYDNTAHAVIWSDQIWPGHPCCIIAVHKDFVSTEQGRNLTLRVLRANIEANQWIANVLQHPESEDYQNLLAMGANFAFQGKMQSGTLNLSQAKDIVEDSLGHIKLGYNITSSVKQGLMNFTTMFADLGQITTMRGYATVDAFINDFVNTTYLQQAMEIQPSETIYGTVKLGYLNGDLHQFARVVAANHTLLGNGKSMFEKYGVDVESASPGPYSNGGAIMDAFATTNPRIIDMAYLGAPPAIQKRLNANIQIQVISLVNLEGSAIMANPDIVGFDGLKDKIVATPGPASIQHLLLLYYATQQGYTLKLAGT
jgi:NitT/TauT family transport system substrate-binding protein